MKTKVLNFLKHYWLFLLSLLLIPIFIVIHFVTYDPAIKEIKQQQEKLLKLNQEITTNSTQWQILEEQQKALSQTNSSLRKQRDELESAIAEAMGLQTGGKATTPSTTMS